MTNFIPVSPFILFKVNQEMLEYNRDNLQILFKAIMTIKEFDRNLEETELETMERVEISCEIILHWFYPATRGKMNLALTIGC